MSSSNDSSRNMESNDGNTPPVPSPTRQSSLPIPVRSGQSSTGRLGVAPRPRPRPAPYPPRNPARPTQPVEQSARQLLPPPQLPPPAQPIPSAGQNPSPTSSLRLAANVPRAPGARLDPPINRIPGQEAKLKPVVPGAFEPASDREPGYQYYLHSADKTLPEKVYKDALRTVHHGPHPDLDPEEETEPEPSIADKQKEFRTALARISEMRLHVKAELEKRQGEIDLLSECNISLQAELMKAREKIEIFEARYGALEDDQESGEEVEEPRQEGVQEPGQEEVQDPKQEGLEELRSKYEAMKESRDHWQRQAEEAETKMNSMKNDQKDMEDKIEDLTAKNQDLTKELGRLKQKLEDMQAKPADTTGESSSLKEIKDILMRMNLESNRKDTEIQRLRGMVPEPVPRELPSPGDGSRPLPSKIPRLAASDVSAARYPPGVQQEPTVDEGAQLFEDRNTQAASSAAQGDLTSTTPIIQPSSSRQGAASKSPTKPGKPEPLPVVAAKDTQWMSVTGLNEDISTKIRDQIAKMVRNRVLEYKRMVTRRKTLQNACVQCEVLAKNVHMCNLDGRVACDRCVRGNEPCGKIVDHEGQIHIGYLPLPQRYRKEPWEDLRHWVAVDVPIGELPARKVLPPRAAASVETSRKSERTRKAANPDSE